MLFILWLLSLNIMSLSSSCLSQVTISFTLSLFNILVVFMFVYVSFLLPNDQALCD